MKLSDFDYTLPKELIALAPPEQRRGSRLLKLDGAKGALVDAQFPDLLPEINEGDLVIFNNTRVIPARLFGKKSTGGKLEILVERVISETSVLAHVRSSKSPKVGAEILIDGDDATITMQGREGALFELQFSEPVIDVLNRVGHMPLPPYIERDDSEDDKERYQTVYSERLGAVAAPTAGLHFDDAFLADLERKGVNKAFVTLHVGAGTFQPVRVDNVLEHHMHSEWVEVTQDVVDLVKLTKRNGGRVIAVGTTSVRSLESAALKTGEIEAFVGDTDIFIYPGYSFNVVDALVTNFHLPESTLLMLISAFAGYNHTMAAYKHAIAEQYRFFSYGDAMFVTRNDHIDIKEVPSEA